MMSLVSWRRRTLLGESLQKTACAALCWLTACSNSKKDQAPTPAPPIDDGASSGLLGGQIPPAGSFVPMPTSLRRLTLAQYRNSVADLLGSSISLPDDLEPDIEVDGFASIGATRSVPSAHGTDQYAAAAQSLAHQVLSDAGVRDGFVGCYIASAPREECARQLIARFGRRAFRRPLDPEEVERYLALYATAFAVVGDFHVGLEYVVSAVLQSPHFLYRAEIGETDSADSNRRRLDSYELAARLSFFLWNTTPDNELLDAAETGELTTDDGLGSQARRLLASPRAEQAVGDFFSELFRLSELDDLPQLPAFFPAMSSTLGVSARRETWLLLGDIVFERDADNRELFGTRAAFVNAELASLYGVPRVEQDFARLELPPERAGLFSRASFLSLNAHASSTSPTRRGKFVRESVLCQVIQPPPPNVNVALRLAPSPAPRTLREQLALHSVNPVCAGCHVPLDPVGLGLEAFDGLGTYRTMEAGRPVDTRGDFDGEAFSGASELGAIVARHSGLVSCLVRDLFRYAIGHLETDGEKPVLAALARNFEAHGYRIKNLLLQSVLSASFRYTGNPD